MNNRSAGGLSSEMQSHHFDTKNNKKPAVIIHLFSPPPDLHIHGIIISDITVGLLTIININIIIISNRTDSYIWSAHVVGMYQVLPVSSFHLIEIVKMF
jgi:hypothetical protein